MKLEDNVLVIKRIHVVYELVAPESARQTIDPRCSPREVSPLSLGGEGDRDHHGFPAVYLTAPTVKPSMKRSRKML
jgi:hypothetical protein